LRKRRLCSDAPVTNMRGKTSRGKAYFEGVAGARDREGGGKNKPEGFLMSSPLISFLFPKRIQGTHRGVGGENGATFAFPLQKSHERGILFLIVGANIGRKRRGGEVPVLGKKMKTPSTLWGGEKSFRNLRTT